MVGGDNPISVQSMTNTLTTDIKATIKQINEIHNEGADIVRVSCPDEQSSILSHRDNLLGIEQSDFLGVCTQSAKVSFLP